MILITQGDSYEERGISAITRLVADRLGAPRALIFLDPAIVDHHTPSAHLSGVISEICFSALANKLLSEAPEILGNIEDAVRKQLLRKMQNADFQASQERETINFTLSYFKK